MKPKEPKNTPAWSYQRRCRLVRQITETINPYDRRDSEERNFNKEAAKFLPKLYREIEKHNSRVRKVNNAAFDRIKNKQLELKNIAWFGSDKAVDAMVSRYLLLDQANA